MPTESAAIIRIRIQRSSSVGAFLASLSSQERSKVALGMLSAQFAVQGTDAQLARLSNDLGEVKRSIATLTKICEVLTASLAGRALAPIDSASAGATPPQPTEGVPTPLSAESKAALAKEMNSVVSSFLKPKR